MANQDFLQNSQNFVAYANGLFLNTGAEYKAVTWNGVEAVTKLQKSPYYRHIKNSNGFINKGCLHVDVFNQTKGEREKAPLILNKLTKNRLKQFGRDHYNGGSGLLKNLFGLTEKMDNYDAGEKLKARLKESSCNLQEKALFQMHQGLTGVVSQIFIASDTQKQTQYYSLLGGEQRFSNIQASTSWNRILPIIASTGENFMLDLVCPGDVKDMSGNSYLLHEGYILAIWKFEPQIDLPGVSASWTKEYGNILWEDDSKPFPGFGSMKLLSLQFGGKNQVVDWMTTLFQGKSCKGRLDQQLLLGRATTQQKNQRENYLSLLVRSITTLAKQAYNKSITEKSEGPANLKKQFAACMKQSNCLLLVKAAITVRTIKGQWKLGWGGGENVWGLRMPRTAKLLLCAKSYKDALTILKQATASTTSFWSSRKNSTTTVYKSLFSLLNEAETSQQPIYTEMLNKVPSEIEAAITATNLGFWTRYLTSIKSQLKKTLTIKSQLEKMPIGTGRRGSDNSIEAQQQVVSQKPQRPRRVVSKRKPLSRFPGLGSGWSR